MQSNPHFKKNPTPYRQLLEPLTDNLNLPSLKTKLKIQDIKNKYPSLKTNKTFYQYLYISFQIINKTRRIIRKSETHPDINLWPLGRSRNSCI